MIREATIQDATAITAIYNYYIKNSVITFEEEQLTSDQMAQRIMNISKEYPYLVYEEEGKILGYAYATKWKERSAYRFSAEATIYLHHEEKGRGRGTKLFSALLDEIKKSTVHSLVGGIALPNPASVALHEKFGFKKLARFEQIGYKHGKWIDVGYWELIL